MPDAHAPDLRSLLEVFPSEAPGLFRFELVVERLGIVVVDEFERVVGCQGGEGPRELFRGCGRRHRCGAGMTNSRPISSSSSAPRRLSSRGFRLEVSSLLPGLADLDQPSACHGILPADAVLPGNDDAPALAGPNLHSWDRIWPARLPRTHPVRSMSATCGSSLTRSLAPIVS